ncbi:MAG: hypothetical protein ABR583_14620 [Gaiellaceae bacterium]
MASSNKKRQTMAKMTRERAVQEKRARKQEKKEEKKQAAAAARDAEAAGILPAEGLEDDTPPVTVDQEAELPR